MILETSTRNHAVPTFSIFADPLDKNNKTLVASLKTCFIKNAKIDITNPPAAIKAGDGWVYTAVYDSRLPVAKEVDVIISFQQHTYGRFAIIRTVNAIDRNKE
jgi:hypothetical protein